MTNFGFGLMFFLMSNVVPVQLLAVELLFLVCLCEIAKISNS